MLEDQIKKLYADGKGAPTIAHELGISQATVYKRLKYAGISTSNRISDEKKEQISALRELGWSLAEISKKVGIKEGSVWYILDKLGDPKRVPVYRLSESELNKLVEKYESGESINALSSSFGFSSHVVKRLLGSRGIEHESRYPSGEANSKWKGGRNKDVHGYISVRITPENEHLTPGRHHGYIKEHRLVMAESLGRKLRKEETVHHINGIRDDNRLENLQLRQGSHGQGQILTCRQCGSHDLKAEPIV